MLSYNLDLEPRSTWLRSTLSARELAQPFQCAEAGCFYALGGFSTERTNKDSYLVFFTLDGQGEVEQGGQVVRLGRGQALLMDCRSPQRYGTAAGSERWYHLWAHVDGSGVREIAQVVGLPTLVPCALDGALARRQFDQVFSLMPREGPRTMLRLGLAVHGLLEPLAEAVLAGSTSDRDAQPVEVAMRMVRERYREPLTVEQMAAEAGVSPSYLVRLFKRQLGTTPYNYLLRWRVTKARELLAETDLPVARVAAEVGFASESNFSYRFGQMVGESPSSYRASSPARHG